jgi:kinetochore protein Spc7/SPC105
MDLTLDLSAPVYDNTTRKSLDRRVSFASHKNVLFFEKNHLKSTGSPRTSSSIPSLDSRQTVGNENNYPGQAFRKRRSSARYSNAGSEDMDLTTVMTAGNFQNTSSAILEEEFDYDGDSFDDMEVTEAIPGNLIRKRSLSMGRQPLSRPESNSPINEVDESQSDIGNDSMQSEGTSEGTQFMEFTVPLDQSLRPPAEQDEVWLALKQVTHSGNEPSEPEPVSCETPQQRGSDGMELEDAVERLMRARDSLPLSTQPASQVYVQDDTFTSTEDSFESDSDGNKTVNLSQVISRLNMDTTARMSLGYQDSNMDESEVYGNIAQSGPRQSSLPTGPPLTEEAIPDEHVIRSTVFHPPPSAARSAASTRNSLSSSSFSFTPGTVSPSKSKSISSPLKIAKPKPTFSAAFAPPVKKSSPKKFNNSVTQPSVKRPRSAQDDEAEYMDADRPSSAKKQSMAETWMGITGPREESSPPNSALANKPRPLSPSRKALFQTDASATTTPSENPSQPQPSGVRRPSGYFARRKSLAVGFNPPASQDRNTPAPQSPKKSTIAFGRSSLGPASANAWDRFDKNSNSEVTEKDGDVRGVAQRTPSPAGRSPALEPASEPGSPSPEMLPAPTITISSATETSETQELSQEMEIDIDATQQWREMVQQTEYEEEEIVRTSLPFICLV